MKIFTTPASMRDWSRAANRKIACVPTMGNLHDGHLSLVAKAHELADLVVLTLFVNPTQFGPNEDFDIYPRTPEDDLERCRAADVDAVFMPEHSIYAHDASVTVVEKSLSKYLCGASRPSHFSGVCTIVAKLFNCVLPDIAIFGQKDAQQVAVIKRMVRDLDFPVEIAVAPIVRENDGLAMSSRNRLLTATQRHAALKLYRSLKIAASDFAAGQRVAALLIDKMRAALMDDELRIDYIEIVDPTTLRPVEKLTPGVLVAVAAYAGQTRLIDNLVLGQEP